MTLNLNWPTHPTEQQHFRNCLLSFIPIHLQISFRRRPANIHPWLCLTLRIAVLPLQPKFTTFWYPTRTWPKNSVGHFLPLLESTTTRFPSAAGSPESTLFDRIVARIDDLPRRAHLNITEPMIIIVFTQHSSVVFVLPLINLHTLRLLGADNRADVAHIL